MINVINYKEDIYEESFADTIDDFNSYVQESVLLAAGAIVGIGALITAIILIIRKIFFKTENQKSAGSVVAVLKTIWTKASSDKYFDDVYVYGVDLQKFSDVVENTKSIIELFDNLIDAVNSKSDTKRIVNDITVQINNTQALINSTVNENIRPESGEGWTTVQRSDLSKFAKSMIDKCKTLANMCKNIDKKAKNVPNDNTDFSNINKNFTALMVNFGKLSNKIKNRIQFREKGD